MTVYLISEEDAQAIGMKVAEMAERLRIAHAVCPGAQAKWRFEADDVRFQIVMTVVAPGTKGSSDE